MGADSLKETSLPDLLEELARRLREGQQDLPPEFQRTIYENIWELYGPPRGRPICEACRRGGVCGCYQPEWDSPVANVLASGK